MAMERRALCPRELDTLDVLPPNRLVIDWRKGMAAGGGERVVMEAMTADVQVKCRG